MFRLKVVFTLFLVLIILDEGSNVELDPSKTIIWGPGLKPAEITMRARYIFLQLVNAEGKNLTGSPGQGVISAQIQAETLEGQPSRIWTQVLDCKDGSFIIRYKIHTTTYNMKLKIKIAEKDSPITILDAKGPIYEEECNCPNPSINKWLKDLECPDSYSQMNEDLAPFPRVDFNKIRQNLIKQYDKPNSVSLCHYIVQSNKIFRNCYGRYVGFKIFVDAILLSMTRKAILPDMEFFVNLGDWPLVPKNGKDYPIFSFCGSSETKDIVMPTYDITESSLEAMGRVMLDMLSVQGNTDTPWEKKVEKVFWRGRDSRRERLDLIRISRENPELFNASITRFFFFKDEIEEYGPGQDHVSFFHFFKYKYQLNIDGTVAAYRFPYLLAGDGLVFKQDSNYYEFFYKDLVPGTHYVPIKKDLSDLVEKVIWAKENDSDAHKIAKTARQFARENLLPKDILCYHGVLFNVWKEVKNIHANEWSKRLKNKVKVLGNMEEVPQPKHSCKCYNGNTNSKEEL